MKKMYVVMDEFFLLIELLQWDRVYGLGLLFCFFFSLKEGSVNFVFFLIVVLWFFMMFGNVLCLIVSLVCYFEMLRYVIYLFFLLVIKEEVYFVVCYL